MRHETIRRNVSGGARHQTNLLALNAAVEAARAAEAGKSPRRAPAPPRTVTSTGCPCCPAG
ncbi:MAG: hypothetical protein U5S82_22960 [Gammaproteobacteria bacterium]|nr:hypothetical protein [Gammaproteobacteria bacterium]